MSSTIEKPQFKETHDQPLAEEFTQNLTLLNMGAQMFAEEHPSSPYGRSLINSEITPISEAIVYIQTNDRQEREELARKSPLAFELSNMLLHEPDSQDRVLSCLRQTEQSLKTLREYFVKDFSGQEKAIAEHEKLEAEVKKAWGELDADNLKAVRDAGVMAGSVLKNIGVFAGISDEPTIEEHKQAIDWVIEKTTGVNVSKCLLNPSETIELFNRIRPETLTEKTINVLGIDKLDELLESLDFDLSAKLRIAGAATMLATSLLLGHASNEPLSNHKSNPVAHVIYYKDVMVKPADVKQVVPQIAKQLGTTKEAIIQANPIIETSNKSASEQLQGSQLDIKVPVNETINSVDPEKLKDQIQPQTLSWNEQTSSVVPVESSLNQASTSTENSTTTTTIEVVPTTQIETTSSNNQLPSSEVLANTPDTAEKFVVRVLQVLADKMGVPESDAVTQDHINGLLAWGFLEQGDLGNTGYYNLFNTGINDPSLLATENNASGIQAFKSLEAGALATVETMMTPNQNRIAKLLTDPSVTSEQFFEGMTYYSRYPGNTYWAQADSDVTLDGVTYTQASYLQSLQSRYSSVISNYNQHAQILMGHGMAIKKNLYAPDSSVLYDGKGHLVNPENPSKVAASQNSEAETKPEISAQQAGKALASIAFKPLNNN